MVLYEYLGEEYPEVLGSILGALKAIVNVIGMTKMTPPIKDLLPRLTPVLKNRHEKVGHHFPPPNAPPFVHTCRVVLKAVSTGTMPCIACPSCLHGTKHDCAGDTAGVVCCLEFLHLDWQLLSHSAWLCRFALVVPDWTPCTALQCCYH